MTHDQKKLLEARAKISDSGTLDVRFLLEEASTLARTSGTPGPKATQEERLACEATLWTLQALLLRVAARLPDPTDRERNFGEWVEVSSSNIAAVRYCSDTRTLRVRFKSRKSGEYDYLGVPAHLFQELLAAESPGRFLVSSIRGCFTAQRVDEPDAPEA